MKSIPKQRQMIGILRKKLNLDDDTYRDILKQYGVNSSLQLDYADANAVIDTLKANAVRMGIYVQKENNYQKYENLKNRPHGMATPAQLRLINVLWKSVSTKETEEEKETALNYFVHNITGKSHMNFLEQGDVKKVVKAIKTMQVQRNLRSAES